MKPDFKKWLLDKGVSEEEYFSWYGNQFAEDYAKKENEEANELLLDAFMQSCSTEDGYDHMCISTWQTAQQYLINVGLIKEYECYRK